VPGGSAKKRQGSKRLSPNGSPRPGDDAGKNGAGGSGTKRKRKDSLEMGKKVDLPVAQPADWRSYKRAEYGLPEREVSYGDGLGEKKKKKSSKERS